MRDMTKRGSIVVSLLLALTSAAAADDAGHALPLWQVDGQQNRVYLLGSIHLLREQDYPISSVIYDAYEDADKLIMELDMDDMDPVEGQILTNELGLIKDGRTLSDLMGSDLYREAEVLAAAAQIPLALLANSEPWYAAMNVEIMLLMRMGFNPQLGVETHFQQLAQGDSKEILGFETMRQQLEFLDGLSPGAQRDMLMQALSEGVELDEMMDSMIAAWQTGDVTFLEDNLLVDRNLDWTDQIEELLDDDIDYLIIVGTLHLVGEDGVPSLLESRGHDVAQLHQPAD
jgi:uncharacterized protein YbaP (TraB family)